LQLSVPLLKSIINQEQLGPALTEQLISSEQCFSADQSELQVEFAATEQLELQLQPATSERSELQLESSMTAQLHLESATSEQPPVQITQIPIKHINQKKCPHVHLQIERLTIFHKQLASY